MNLPDLLLVAVGLSMDAFAAAVCLGLSLWNFRWRKAVFAGLYFGVFQGAMPLAGYWLAARFRHFILPFGHWIAFFLLGIIGGRMIAESFTATPGRGRVPSSSLRPAKMVPLALATSIDALAVGISFAFLPVHILPAAALIGAVTFVLCTAGVRLGHLVGPRLHGQAEFIGGCLLLLIGIKILAEGLG